MSSVVNSVANVTRSAYTLAFQVSPIILQNGIAAGVPGGMMPIVALTGQLASFAQGLVTNGLSANDFFAEYLPIPGSTVISNAVGMYPFANQQTAANAIIQTPLTISLLMISPVKDYGGYLTKLPVFTSLRASLQKHNLMGGTYSIATPSLIYPNCIMTGMTDVTGGESKQQQTQWQLDFVQPLITLAQAASAQSNLMQTATNGGQISGAPAWSGTGGVGSVNTTGLPAAVTPITATPLGAP